MTYIVEATSDTIEPDELSDAILEAVGLDIDFDFSMKAGEDVTVMTFNFLNAKDEKQFRRNLPKRWFK